MSYNTGLNMDESSDQPKLNKIALPFCSIDKEYTPVYNSNLERRINSLVRFKYNIRYSNIIPLEDDVIVTGISYNANDGKHESIIILDLRNSKLKTLYCTEDKYIYKIFVKSGWLIIHEEDKVDNEYVTIKTEKVWKSIQLTNNRNIITSALCPIFV